MIGMSLKEQNISLDNYTYQYYSSTYRENFPVLIMLHGIAASKDFMMELANTLSETYNCFLLDLPGHNGLELNGIEKFDDFAEYLKKFISYINPKEFCILGYSLGGMIALKYAENYADIDMPKLSKVVVWSSPVLGFNNGLSTLVKASLPIVNSIPNDLFDSVAKNKKIIEYLNQALKIAGTYGPVPVEPLSKFSLENAKRIINISTLVNFEINLHTPVLYIFDKYDPIVHPKNYLYVNNNHNPTTSKVVLVNRGGHFKNRNGFSRVKEEIGKFLETNNKISGAEGGTRTHTPLRELPPEDSESANSSTSAYAQK